MLQLVREPEIIAQEDRAYIGIRFTAPYRNMFSQVDVRMKRLKALITANKLRPDGPFFLRYHMINMTGDMELEVGVFGDYAVPISSDATSGMIPGGLYATQIYKGLGLAANKYLLDWIGTNNHVIQKESHADGDRFACRYEAYLTDPRKEPRKKQWNIELSIKIVS